MRKCLAVKLSLALSIFLIWGCGDKEVPKKVSLNKRAPSVDMQERPSEAGSLKFGFDLRLGPKEDVKIYLPFLRYLEQNAGNKFSLRFTEKYEDTVENLGKGITDFAALGPVNCVLQQKNTAQAVLLWDLIKRASRNTARSYLQGWTALLRI